MPAVTDRPEAVSPKGAIAWDQRPIAGRWHGLPWWEAALIALGATVFATMIDVAANDQPTTLSEMIYWLSCVVAICVVRRRNVFTPMVMPPLVLAIGLPLGLLPSKGLPDSFEFRDLALTYGIPVINSFPVMALTTVFTLLIGAFRLFRERDPDRVGRSGAHGGAGARSSASSRAGGRAPRPSRGSRSSGATAAGNRAAAERETPGGPRTRRATVDGRRPTPTARRRRAADTDVFDAPKPRAAPSPSGRPEPTRRRPVPRTDEPAAPTSRRPATDEPARRRPATDEPARRRPATDEPVRGDLLGGRAVDDAPRRGRIERPWEVERANPQAIPSAEGIEPPPIRRRMKRGVEGIDDLTGERPRRRRRYRDD